MRILHIGGDSQFLCFAAKTFESVAPRNSTYLVMTSDGSRKLKNPLPSENVLVTNLGFSSWKAIFCEVRSDYDSIIVHSLSGVGVLAFLLARNSTKLVWSGWGADYYLDQDLSGTNLYENLTLEYIVGKERRFRQSFLKKIIAKAKFHAKRLAISRVDYFSAPISQDVNIMKQGFPNFSGSFIQILYGSVSSTFSVGSEKKLGKNILLGNSASATNNHLEVFHLLKSVDLGDRKIIVPLSYGDVDYGKYITSKGYELLGNSFVPVIEFMPLPQYNDLIASCEIVIMNHIRQQALGNICAAFYKGAKVFLNKNGVLFDFFTDHGSILFSLDQLLVEDQLNSRLSDAEVQINRSVLEASWGENVAEEKVSKLIAAISSTKVAQR